ncbi:MAG: putative glycoside hydrolase [Actinomycetes bacterium]
MATGLVAIAVVAVPVVMYSSGSISVDGLKNNELLGKPALAALTVRIAPHGVSGSSLKAKLDSTPVSLTKDGKDYVAQLGSVAAGLTEGKHSLTVTGSGGILGSPKATRSFRVDTTPPQLHITVPTQSVAIGSPVDVTGTVTQGSTVTVQDGQATVDGSTVHIHFAHPPLGVPVVATDAAGNKTVFELTVPTAYPVAVRGLHMTGYAWASTKLRNPILALARQHRINTVELDIKEEDGIVDFDPGVPLATQIGAVQKKYDPVAVVKQLHAMGVRVMGRIVAFNDPKLGKWAWAHGHKDWVIQDGHGHPYVYGYAKSNFGNFANPNVRKYNIDLAVAAAKAGFDDIVFDYIRRPDGKISTMSFPGLRGSPEVAVANFARDAAAQLHPLGKYVGATIFAQAALPNRSAETAQNVPMMAKYLDAVMPMDYPSHWATHELGVADPHTDAYGIVRRSLPYWIAATKGTFCKVVPWLQDENFRGTYDAHKVGQEIKGARDTGLPGWVMWAANAKYTGAAFSPDAPRVMQ